MMRTLYCGDLREAHIGQTVTLCGWVNRRRDHGGLIFLDVRDRYGFTQVVIQPENKDVFAQAEKVRPEWVLQITGTVQKRIAGAERAEHSRGRSGTCPEPCNFSQREDGALRPGVIDVFPADDVGVAGQHLLKDSRAKSAVTWA